jgi:hypothetical protein
MTNPLRDGIGRVDGRLLLRALGYIAGYVALYQFIPAPIACYGLHRRRCGEQVNQQQHETGSGCQPVNDDDGAWERLVAQVFAENM